MAKPQKPHRRCCNKGRAPRRDGRTRTVQCSILGTVGNGRETVQWHPLPDSRSLVASGRDPRVYRVCMYFSYNRSKNECVGKTPRRWRGERNTGRACHSGRHATCPP